MKSNLSIIKGIHPGIILGRELQQRHLAKGRFAISLQEFPQTLVSIIKGKRRMNTALSLKIEQALGLEEGYFMMLQLYYDIAKEKQKQPQIAPNLSKFRPVLFWDTNINKIDWEKQKKAVINRVFERGNQIEKDEIRRFYGKENVQSLLNKHDK
jgi:plasmid maintenance system antidote protein VapI